MTKEIRLNKLDKQLIVLRKNNLSVKELQILSFCRKERTFVEIAEVVGMTPDSTKKAIAKIGKYFMKVKTKTKARGSLPIQIVLNDTGKALIDIFK